MSKQSITEGMTVLKKENGKPLYKTLYEALVDDILSGILAPGSKLLSRRRLSHNLGVSVATVTAAYELLIDNGFVMSSPKRGYFVLRESESLSNVHETSWESTDFVYNLSYNASTVALAPVRQFASALRSTINNSICGNETFFGHVSKRGEYDLRMALLNFLYRERNIHCDIDHTVISGGYLYMLEELILLFDPDTVFAIQDPCDMKISSLFKKLNRRLVCLMSGYGVADLEKFGVTVLLIYPEHHMPSGTFTPYPKRLELCRWLHGDNRRYIIENPFDYDLIYNGDTHRAIYDMDDTGRVVYTESFEQSFAPAVKTSYMLMPDTLLNKMRESYYCSYASKSEQLVLAEMLNNGAIKRYHVKLRQYYRDMCEYIRHCIEISPLGAYTDIINDYAGNFFLIKVNSELTSEELVSRALKSGLKILSLKEISVSPNDSCAVIFGFADQEREQIPKILYLLTMAWSGKAEQNGAE